MKIILLKEDERIQEGLRSLTEEFNEEHPYYSTWIQENKETFEDGSRVVHELSDNGNVVGYMMIHDDSFFHDKLCQNKRNLCVSKLSEEGICQRGFVKSS